MKERTEEIHVLFLPEEMKRLKKKMEELGIRNRSAYVRKMVLDGYCVKLDLDDVKEMVSLLRRCSNNINQCAKKANEPGSFFEEDIWRIQNQHEEVWNLAKNILVKLSSI